MEPPGIAAVILAAGEGRRAGGPKAFCLWRDPDTGRQETFLTRVARVVQEGGACPVVAVVRPGDRQRVAGLVSAGVGIVENPCPDRGMMSSLRCGVDALPRDVAGVLVVPVDHPEVLAGTVATLIGAFCQEEALWVPTWQRRPGHPIVLPYSLARRVPADDLPGGLAAWLRGQGVRRRAAAVQDPGVLRNCNEGPGSGDR